MSLAAFRRTIRVGQRVTVVNHIHPHLSGERTVHAVRGRDLVTNAEGDPNPLRAAWPRSGEWRIEGNTLHWLAPPNHTTPGHVRVSYTFHDDKPEAPAATEDATTTPAEPEELWGSYRVSWEITGRNLPSRTTTLILDEAQIARFSDWDERLHAMRRMIANKYLPIGEMDPGNVTILDAHPLCNCAPFPDPKNCAYAEDKGHRFHLTRSSKPGYEVIHDRHRSKILGTVDIGLSVELLTLVQRKYGHQ
ncbi:hypothetical protein AB0M10_15165 [Streptomyces sp. NPDC051840]|uniref:hypothetical protein n=1 Tax=Streptomyces sp. NPDC051840 TaxID=3154752 RepID=UPI003445F876